MEKLFEFLTGKIGYTALIILGFLLPGMLFVFVWNRDIYAELGIIRLIILALAISFSLFICNCLTTAFIFMLQDKVRNEKSDIFSIIGLPLSIANVEIYFGLMYKLNVRDFSISDFIDVVLRIDGLLLIGGIFPSAVKLLWRKIKKDK